MHTDFYYPSAGGGMIHGCRWEPAGEPVAVLQIVHGVAEHVYRYAEFASFLAEKGILVVAADHMGHGLSIGDGEAVGIFRGGWFKALADVHRLFLYIRKENPDIPYILLGHSMGSFLARSFLCRYPDSGICAAILSGTAWMPRAVINSGKAAATLVGKRKGMETPSKFLNDMMFGSYCNRIENPRTPSDWLTRDEKIVDDYVADPLCGFTITPGLARDMMTGLRYIQEPANLAKMCKTLPVWFIAGEEDPVGGYGSGVKRAAKEFQKAGMEKVSLKLYPQCRHEILNELNKEEVFDDVLTWLKEQGFYA
jgi:alpha-beta hydrolase superfamily lysophospholipase